MRNYATLTLVLLLTGLFVLTSCRPPEIEGTVLNMQKELYDDALASAQSAIEKYPQNAEAWFYWGYLNGDHKKNYEEMNRGFAKALELNPSQKVSYNGASVTAETAINAERSNRFADNYNGAIQTINKARDTEDEAAKNELYQQALEKLNVATLVDPSRHEPYQPLALSYISIGDTAKAEEALEKGLEKNPGDELLTIAAGEVYSMTGSLDKAEMQFKRALEMNPENSDLYQKLGVMESNRQNWEKANEYYEKAIELNPDNADLAYNIGVGYYNQQNYTEAIPFFKKALEAEPDNELTYTVLAGCYVRTEDNAEEAITFLETATQKFPEDATYWEYLAILYGKKGDSEKADTAFQKSKELKGEK